MSITITNCSIKWEVLIYIIFLSTNSLLFAQSKTCDTIYPSATIRPFQLTGDELVNFPMVNPEPCGDINGDGLGDLVFRAYAANERTLEPSDIIYKSLITFDTGYNSNAVVRYNKNLKGCGDFNGDGFDDVFDIYNNIIHYGCPQGISEDSLALNFSSDFTGFAFPGDLDNDGMSEILIGKVSGIIDKMLIFSAMDTVPYVITNSGSYFVDVEKMRFISYDYDNDGTMEFCIINKSLTASNSFKTRWYHIDKIDHQMILEYSEDISYIHEPSYHYPKTISDIDGDGFMDLTHVFYDSDTTQGSGFDISVNFGLAVEPYFSEPYTIQVKNDGRLFYNAGDFNGDGADDWYSIATQDSIVIYYGNPDILTNGFLTEYYYMGDNQLLMPKSKYNSYFSSSTDQRLYYFNNDTIADIFFCYWSFDENQQYDFVGTAIVPGGNNPDFTNPLLIGRSGNDSFKSLEYGYLTKNIGDFNRDGYEDWGVLSRSGCYLEIFFGGEEMDMYPDITYFLPQTNFAKSYDWSFGDLNGDDWLDIVISNSSMSNVNSMRYYMTERDEVYVFFGEPFFQNEYNFEDADVILYDKHNTFLEFGANLGVVGDYNIDGYDDIVIGGAKNNKCERDVFLYFGGEQINPEPDLVYNEPGYQ